ncbi:sulfotransferase family protein [Coleofasciculus sp. G2-EDA-02]|uniref:sulfotransferase family protein n=1 Tax=Coleofasciculus sp. G2-EDA-02 TaxID=3069529 RepID=UPI0032F890CD
MNRDTPLKTFSNLGGLRTLLGKSARRVAYHYYSWTVRQPPLKLFLLSHMRSGSSLLTHILNTNPEILGFGETWIQYSSEENFNELIAEVHFSLRKFKISEKYILDKILHNHLIINPEILRSDQVYLIFLIREPQNTLPSILKLLPKIPEKTAFNYYTERLLTLEKYAQLVGNTQRNLVITYNQLCRQNELVFKALQDFIDVQHPFSEEYEVLKTTGRRGVGDPSSNIKAGKIMKSTQTQNRQISSELIEESMKIFDQCYINLSQSCSKVDSD